MKKYIAPIVWLTALAVIAGLLLGYEYHTLWKIQEQSLFLDTPLFFQQQMVVPGGLLTYIGCFLTQLFGRRRAVSAVGAADVDDAAHIHGQPAMGSAIGSSGSIALGSQRADGLLDIPHQAERMVF